MSVSFFAPDSLGVLKDVYDCSRCEYTGQIDPDCPQCKGHGEVQLWDHELSIQVGNATAYYIFVHLGLKPETEGGTWAPDQLPEIRQRLEKALTELQVPLISDGPMIHRLKALSQIVGKAHQDDIPVFWG